MLASDYQKIMYTLLPVGLLWPEQEGDAPIWDMVFKALAAECARVDLAAGLLIDEAIPDAEGYLYPDELLPAWERVAGLPDEYTPSGQTDTQRRQALIAKLRGPGSPTLAKFENLVEPYGYLTEAFDGWRLVDSIDRTGGGAVSWVGGTGGTGTVGGAADPDGGFDADIITLPSASSYVQARFLRMSSYEGCYVSCRLRLAGTAGPGSVKIEILGRDGAVKWTTTEIIKTTWQRYEISVADIGLAAGATKVLLKFTHVTGSNVTLHAYQARGGWRERYFPWLGAGEPVGLPCAPEWAHAFGLEYGADLVSRDVDGNPNWTTSGAGHIHEDYETDPISRQALAEGLHHALGTPETFSVGILGSDRYIRFSLWLKATVGFACAMTVSGRAGTTVYASGTMSVYDWQKIEGLADLGVGGSTPQVRILVSFPAIELVIGHIRVSAVDTQLEGRVGQAAPLHTVPVFGSYGEYTEYSEE